jgi:hypothetical protein
MSALSVNPPYPVFTDIDGQPLEDGYIWIGTANLNPLTSPITVYWDAALTIPAGQPIRTIGGYPMRAGTPARLYAGSDYSIQVQNKNGSVLYSAPVATERLSSDLVTFIQAGAGAVERTAQSKMRETVSVKDFGAVGDGVTDDTAAIQAALTYAGTIKCGVYVPGSSASYLVTDEFTVPDGVTVFGDGWGSFIQQNTLNKDVFITGDCNTFQNLRLKVADGNNADFVNCIYAVNVNNLTVESCFLEPGDLGGCGIHIRGVQNSQIRGNRIYGGKWTSGAGAAASAADILLYSSGTSERHIIEGNHCLSNNSQGMFVSALGYDGDIIIANNICVTLDPATCTETGTWALVANGGVRRHGMVVSYVNAQTGRPRIIVDGNICRNTTWTGIYKQGTSDNEVIISNNLCDLNGYAGSGISLSGGIYVESPGKSSVIGNTITNFQNTNTATGGITVNQASAENVPGLISSNKITGSLGAGIALGTSARLMTVSNNLITGSASNDIYSVNTAGSAVVGGHTIINNTIYRTSGNNIPSIFYEQQNSTRYAEIKNNTIRGFDNTNNDVLNAAIRLRESSALIRVIGNAISNFYYGLTCVAYYSGRLVDHVIEGNIITDCAVGFGVSATNNNSTLPLVGNRFVNTASQTTGPIGSVVGRIVDRLGQNFIWQTTASPAAGSWEVGDRSANSTPAVGQPKGWLCTVAGTPGTWVSEGNL